MSTKIKLAQDDKVCVVCSLKKGYDPVFKEFVPKVSTYDEDKLTYELSTMCLYSYMECLALIPILSDMKGVVNIPLCKVHHNKTMVHYDRLRPIYNETIIRHNKMSKSNGN